MVSLGAINARSAALLTRAFCVLGFVLGMVPAQSFDHLREVGVVALRQAVRDAGRDVQFLLVASHPDDRYVMPAAKLRFLHGFRVAVLLATRGEGGQNANGPETGAALGAVRTLEAEACAARLGIDLYYLNAPDRGYTRSAEEAFRQWNRSRTVADMARVLRSVRPEVVLTTHHEAESHGHDLAVLDMIPQAVTLAGDPSFDPDGDPPVLVQRLFVGSSPGERGGQYRIVEGMDERDPDRGGTYRELAYRYMTEENESQQPYAAMDELFDPRVALQSVGLRGKPPSRTLFDDLPDMFDLLRGEPDADLPRIQQWERWFRDLSSATRATQIYAAHQLLEGLGSHPAADGSELALRIDRRVEALERVLRNALSLSVRALVDPGLVAVPGESVLVRFSVQKAPEHDDRAVEGIRVEGLDGVAVDVRPEDERGPLLVGGRRLVLSGQLTVPLGWSEPDAPPRRVFTHSTFRSPVRVRCSFRVMGREMSLDLALPIEVRPAVELEALPRGILLAAGQRTAEFQIRIRRNTLQRVQSPMRIRGPAGYVVEGVPRSVEMSDETRSVISGLTLTVPAQVDSQRRDLEPQTLRVTLGDQLLKIPVHRVDVRVNPHLKVALIAGRDNATREVLWGLLRDRLRILDPADVLTVDLREFDTVVVDVRAGAALPGGFQRLKDFAQLEGRRLVVFYHKDKEFNAEFSGFVGYPYPPFRIGKGRVTQEDAPVQILRPEHVVLTRPNRIGPDDWDGWVQERGLYFPSEFGANYEALLSIADDGQSAQNGSLLYTRYGEGEYVYCALALYRQLKNLHSGAVRLLANLITPS